MNKVRFHLGAGQFFKHWQVKNSSGVKFFNPDSTAMLLTNCKLKNNKRIAQLILDGNHKTVCAYIQCEKVEFIDLMAHNSYRLEKISFNPKVKPYWFDQNGDDVDGEKYDLLATIKNQVFACYPL